MNETGLIPYNTATSMVETYNTATEEIQQAYTLLAKARDRLIAVFEDSYLFDTLPDRNHYGGLDDKTADVVIGRIRRSAWRAIVDKVEIRRMLSTKRDEEISKMLEDGELPELTVDNMFETLKTWSGNLENYMVEAVKEVYELLRPNARKHWGNIYKTNEKYGKYDLGKKVIMANWVERQYGRHGFRIRYTHNQDCKNVENVFKLLDGKGAMSGSYYGDLHDSIEKAETGRGETEYFRFKAHKNTNLHIEFKRMDLVRRLNAVAGGKKLKDVNS